MVTFVGYGAACPDCTVGDPHPIKSPRGAPPKVKSRRARFVFPFPNSGSPPDRYRNT